MQTKPVYVVAGKVHGVTYYLQSDGQGSRDKSDAKKFTDRADAWKAMSDHAYMDEIKEVFQ